MNSQIKKAPDGTITLTITIPWKDVRKEWEEHIQKIVEEAELPGFRKGKAPRATVEKNINKDALREEVLRHLLPQAYIDAVKEHDLKPIMNPKIHIHKTEEGKDWEFEAHTTEQPEVKLGKYKDKVKSLTAKEKIVVPGKEQQKVDFDEIVAALLSETQVTIPSILINNEVERLLAQTLDEVRRLGLSLDQYLSSTGKTIEQLKTEYAQRAEKDIKLEFALGKIGEEEKITVESKEIEEALEKAKSPEERQNLEANRYLLANILRQQKTLDYLRSL